MNSAASTNEQIDTVAADDPGDTPDQSVSSDDRVEPAPKGSVGAEPVKPASSDCPIISSEAWGAWIEKNGDENRLTVSGRVTWPSAGYRTSLVFGETRESNPPGQTIKLVFRAPTGPAAQVVTEKEVVEQFSGLPAYSEVTITCGGKTIGRVGKVVTTLG